MMSTSGMSTNTHQLALHVIPSLPYNTVYPSLYPLSFPSSHPIHYRYPTQINLPHAVWLSPHTSSKTPSSSPIPSLVHFFHPPLHPSPNSILMLSSTFRWSYPLQEEKEKQNFSNDLVDVNLFHWLTWCRPTLRPRRQGIWHALYFPFSYETLA